MPSPPTSPSAISHHNVQVDASTQPATIFELLTDFCDEMIQQFNSSNQSPKDFQAYIKANAERYNTYPQAFNITTGFNSAIPSTFSPYTQWHLLQGHDHTGPTPRLLETPRPLYRHAYNDQRSSSRSSHPVRMRREKSFSRPDRPIIVQKIMSHHSQQFSSSNNDPDSPYEILRRSLKPPYRHESGCAEDDFMQLSNVSPRLSHIARSSLTHQGALFDSMDQSEISHVPLLGTDYLKGPQHISSEGSYNPEPMSKLAAYDDHDDHDDPAFRDLVGGSYSGKEHQSLPPHAKKIIQNEADADTETFPANNLTDSNIINIFPAPHSESLVLEPSRKRRRDDNEDHGGEESHKFRRQKRSFLEIVLIPSTASEESASSGSSSAGATRKDISTPSESAVSNHRPTPPNIDCHLNLRRSPRVKKQKERLD